MSIEITEDFINNIMHKENDTYESYSWNDYSPYPNVLTVIFENNIKLEDIKEEDSPKVKLDKIIDKIKNIDTPNLYLLSMSEWNQNEKIIKSLDIYIKQKSLKIKEYKFTKDEVNYVTDKLYFEFTNKKDEGAIHIIDALTEVKKNIFEDKEFFNKVEWVEGLWEDKEYREKIENKLKIVAQNLVHTVYYDADYSFIDFIYVDKRDLSRMKNQNYKFIKEYFTPVLKKDEVNYLESYECMGIDIEKYMVYDGNYGIEKDNKIPYRENRGFSDEILTIVLECSPAEKISDAKYFEGVENKNGWKSNMDFINLGTEKYEGILKLLFPKDNFPSIRKWDAYIERDSINILNLILREDIEAPELEEINNEEEIIKIFLEKIKDMKEFFIPLQFLDKWTADEDLVKRVPIYVNSKIEEISNHNLYLVRAEKQDKNAVHIIDKLKSVKKYYINKKEIEDLALAEGYYRDTEFKEEIVKIIQDLGTKIHHLAYAFERKWDKKSEIYLHNSDIRRMCRLKKYNFINELFEVPGELTLDLLSISIKDVGNYKVYEKKWKFEGQDFEADEEIVKILIENRKSELKEW